MPVAVWPDVLLDEDLNEVVSVTVNFFPLTANGSVKN